MDLQIVSYAGHPLQTASLEAYFPGDAWVRQARSQAVTSPRAYTAPAYTYLARQAHMLPVAVRLRNITASEIDTLKSHFDTADPTEKKLLVRDLDDGNKQWYVMGVCVDQPEASRHHVTFTLAVADMVWTEESQSSESWSITASGQTKQITPGGNRPALPIFEIQPTSARSGGSDNGFAYERFVVVKNNSGEALLNYPFELTDGGMDTQTPVGAGKMQADGDDVRVTVDGVEVERWFADFNHASDTKIWTVLSRIPPQTTATLDGNHSDSTTTFNVTRTSKKIPPLESFPAQGFAIVESEIVFYSAKDDKKDTLTVTRGVQGSSAAAHNDGTTIQLIPDVRLFYGNSALSAPVQTDKNKPVFELDASTNSSWVYADFATEAGGRAGAWTPSVLKAKGDDTDTYTADHAADADPASEMGMTIASYKNGAKDVGEDGVVVWTIDHPCGVTTVSTSGEKYRSDGDWPSVAALQVPKKSGKKKKKKWTNVWNEATPGSEDSWTAFTQNSVALGGTYNSLRYALDGSIGGGDGYLAHLEISDVTLALTGTPTVSMGGEQSSTYELAATITNNLTGESIKLQGAIPLNDKLIVDTESKRVYLNSDGSPLLSYLSWDAVRFDWLKLLPGQANTLQYDEDGAQGLTVTIKWRDRNN